MAYLPWPLLKPIILAIIALIAIQTVHGDREACSRLCGKYMEKPPVRPVDRFTVKGRAGRGRWSPETSGPRWAPQTSGNRPSRWKPSLSASPNSGLAGRSFRPSQLESVNGVPVSSLGGGPAYNAAPGGYAPSSSFPSWQSSSSWHSSSGPSWASRPSSSSGSLDDSWGGDTSHGSKPRRWDTKTAGDEHPLKYPLKGLEWDQYTKFLTTHDCLGSQQWGHSYCRIREEPISLEDAKYIVSVYKERINKRFQQTDEENFQQPNWWEDPVPLPSKEKPMHGMMPSPQPSPPPSSNRPRPRPPSASCTTLLCPLDRPKSSGAAGPSGHSNIVGQASNALKQFFGG